MWFTMRILRWIPALFLTLLAMHLSPRSQVNRPVHAQRPDDSKNDPFERLSDEMNQVRSAAAGVYLAAGIFVLGGFLLIGVISMEESPFPPPDFDFQHLSWAIGVVAVLVVAFMFERHQSLPSRLEPELDHVQLALLMRRKRMIVVLSYCILGLTALLGAMTVVGWISVGYEPLSAFVALLLLGVFGVAFCEYALLARADAGFLDELEDRRDARLVDAYDRLLCAVDPRIARRVAAGGTLALMVATVGWAIGAYSWAGVPAVVVVAMVPTWTYLSGLQVDAKSELQRLRRTGPDKVKAQTWILRFGATVAGTLGGLLYPAGVMSVVSVAKSAPLQSLVCIALALVLCWLPIGPASARFFRWEQRKFALRRKQLIARRSAQVASARALKR